MSVKKYLLPTLLPLISSFAVLGQRAGSHKRAYHQQSKNISYPYLWQHGRYYRNDR